MSAVRPATLDDIPELLRHRELLFTAMGRDPDGAYEWREATVRTFQETLGGDSMAVFVVDGQVVSDGRANEGGAVMVGDGRANKDGAAVVGDGRVDGDGRVKARWGLAASGVGVIDRRLPGPETPNGLWGHVSGMVTDPGHRRRGHGRAIMTELLAWFHAHEVRRIELNATPHGDALYRGLGFTEPHAPALTWTA